MSKTKFESEHYRVVKTRFKRKDLYQVRDKLTDKVISEYTDQEYAKAAHHVGWLESMRRTFE